MPKSFYAVRICILGLSTLLITWIISTQYGIYLLDFLFDPVLDVKIEYLIFLGVFFLLLLFYLLSLLQLSQNKTLRQKSGAELLIGLILLIILTLLPKNDVSIWTIELFLFFSVLYIGLQSWMLAAYARTPAAQGASRSAGLRPATFIWVALITYSIQIFLGYFLWENRLTDAAAFRTDWFETISLLFFLLAWASTLHTPFKARSKTFIKLCGALYALKIVLNSYLVQSINVNMDIFAYTLTAFLLLIFLTLTAHEMRYGVVE